MLHLAEHRWVCSILALGIVTCTPAAGEPGADSDLCARYKRALLRYQRVDPQMAPPPLAGSYDAYRCPPDVSPDAQTQQPSLAECTLRLEALCPEGESCTVELAGRGTCTSNILIFERPDLHLPHEGVGAACDLGAQLDAFAPSESALRSPAHDCETLHCLLFQATGPYCSCRCSGSRVNEPTCRCPSGFTCQADLIPTGDSEGARDGYCVHQD